MKITVHAEGTAMEIASELRAVAAVYEGDTMKARVTTAGKAATVTSATVKPSKAAKASKAAATEATEDEEFDLGDTEEEETELEASDSEEEEVEEDETEEEETEPAADLEDVIGAFQKYAKKHSREKALKVLARFKVKSVRDLKPKQFSEVLSLIQK